MSISIAVSLVCDKCQTELCANLGEKARAVRAAGKKEGWMLTRKADFCPSCRKDIEAAVAEARKGNI